MIQRIQTLFLLFAAVLDIILVALPLPFAESEQPIQASALFADAQYDVFDQPAMLALFALGGLLALIAIFLFKKRPVQIKLTLFAFIATFIGFALAILMVLQDGTLTGGSSVSIDDEPGAFFPLLSLLMLLFALRFIRKDEKLVRSMDRLR